MSAPLASPSTLSALSHPKLSIPFSATPKPPASLVGAAPASRPLVSCPLAVAPPFGPSARLSPLRPPARRRTASFLPRPHAHLPSVLAPCLLAVAVQRQAADGLESQGIADGAADGHKVNELGDEVWVARRTSSSKRAGVAGSPSPFTLLVPAAPRAAAPGRSHAAQHRPCLPSRLAAVELPTRPPCFAVIALPRALHRRCPSPASILLTCRHPCTCHDATRTTPHAPTLPCRDSPRLPPAR
ncbi:hypothetical protein BS78_10G189700 [Paspalum vaginatum]|nr:hypothetical protein BS78_10G189700 [Paspalum vaginatum]